MHLRRVCIVLLASGVFYKCLLGLVGLKCCSSLLVSLLIFSLVVLSIIESVILKSPNIIIKLPLPSFLIVFVCLFLTLKSLLS